MKAFIFLLLLLSFLPSGVRAADVLLDERKLCRAAISTVMNKEFPTVEIKRQVKNVIYLSFPLEKNERTSSLKCLVKGRQVIWATEMGSWRDSDLDATLMYEVVDQIVQFREYHKNGSVFRKNFRLQDLKTQKK